MAVHFPDGSIYISVCSHSHTDLLFITYSCHSFPCHHLLPPPYHFLTTPASPPPRSLLYSSSFPPDSLTPHPPRSVSRPASLPPHHTLPQRPPLATAVVECPETTPPSTYNCLPPIHPVTPSFIASNTSYGFCFRIFSTFTLSRLFLIIHIKHLYLSPFTPIFSPVPLLSFHHTIYPYLSLSLTFVVHRILS